MIFHMTPKNVAILLINLPLCFKQTNAGRNSAFWLRTFSTPSKTHKTLKRNFWKKISIRFFFNHLVFAHILLSTKYFKLTQISNTQLMLFISHKSCNTNLPTLPNTISYFFRTSNKQPIQLTQCSMKLQQRQPSSAYLWASKSILDGRRSWCFHSGHWWRWLPKLELR